MASRNTPANAKRAVTGKNLNGGRSAAGREPMIRSEGNLKLGSRWLRIPTVSRERCHYGHKPRGDRMLLKLRDDACVICVLGILVEQLVELR
jgi:hypothetical protein